MKVASTFLSEGRSVAVGESLLVFLLAFIDNGAIDNTNADVPTRAVWVDLATRTNVPIRCVYFTAPAKLCEHSELFSHLFPIEYFVRPEQYFYMLCHGLVL